MKWGKVRGDFPLLGKKIKGKRIIYFDNACNTLRPRQVIDSITDYHSRLSSCAGKRSSHALSKETEEKCIQAREKTERFINSADNGKIMWTKNTTEAVNLVANSLEIGKGKNVVCSVLDHHSLSLPFHKKSQKEGLELRVVECSRDGLFETEAWEKAIDRNTRAVLLTHASNVTGSILQAEEIIKIAHESKAIALLDCAQSAPHLQLDMKKLDCDFACFSMHKMLGPGGMGVLFAKNSALEGLGEFMVGGDTVRNVKYAKGRIMPEYLPAPKKFEAGLQDYAGIIGSGSAIEYLASIGMEKIRERDEELSKIFLEKTAETDGIELIGPKNPEKRLATFSFILKSCVSPKDLAEFMDTELKGSVICIQAGTHCANPFHYFIGIDPEKGEGTTRASLYFYNTKEEIGAFFEALGLFLEKTG
ncbi:MAG: aminotransferase class V-fold PLP-dependent enzyme [Candidatus Diapherotrites archaeon]